MPPFSVIKVDSDKAQANRQFLHYQQQFNRTTQLFLEQKRREKADARADLEVERRDRQEFRQANRDEEADIQQRKDNIRADSREARQLAAHQRQTELWDKQETKMELDNKVQAILLNPSYDDEEKLELVRAEVRKTGQAATQSTPLNKLMDDKRVTYRRAGQDDPSGAPAGSLLEVGSDGTETLKQIAPRATYSKTDRGWVSVDPETGQTSFVAFPDEAVGEDYAPARYVGDPKDPLYGNVVQDNLVSGKTTILKSAPAKYEQRRDTAGGTFTESRPYQVNSETGQITPLSERQEDTTLDKLSKTLSNINRMEDGYGNPPEDPRDLAAYNEMQKQARGYASELGDEKHLEDIKNSSPQVREMYKSQAIEMMQIAKKNNDKRMMNDASRILTATGASQDEILGTTDEAPEMVREKKAWKKSKMEEYQFMGANDATMATFEKILDAYLVDPQNEKAQNRLQAAIARLESMLIPEIDTAD